ncbi:23S rRNA (uracil(1939)-C(5))-methyltransferase RlmD [Peptoniphilus catoniae]|uniref:23S rRNA (uracil(1939)-C(5))-methyltransferase RlmD n=1 Tax=Peptoniphilus catoniae TaxID=1660341 RepID=UPI0010FEA4AE|nr:23S rRNA (uracil(1939)-C(5))-methyltransferase RlmD [Peptoniphilus catoniae]
MAKNKTIEGIIQEVDFPNKSTIIYDGNEIKIKGGILGQIVEIKKVRRNKGRLLKVLEKSSLEEEHNCPHLKECGGCTYQTMTYEKELSYKKKLLEKLFSKISIDKIDLIPSPNYTAYRNKMEYTFSDEYKDGPLSLGLHKKNKFYEVVNTDECNIVDQDFNQIRDYTKKYFDGLLKPYHKIRHNGALRHLLIRRNLKGDLLVNLVTSSEKYDYSGYFDSLLELPLKGRIAGLIHTINDSPSDAIVPEKVEVYYGKDYLIEEIDDLKFKISLYSFFQTNTESAKLLYQEAKNTIGNIEGLNLLDLYSGTGTITQIIGKQAKSALGIEIVEEAVKSARENAKLNKLDKIKFICGDVFEEVKNLNYKPDIIVLDPPREGINPRAINKIIDFNVDKYLYISCNPVTLLRDLEVFKERGYKIEKLKAIDQFPRTYHVECVALLIKK